MQTNFSEQTKAKNSQTGQIKVNFFYLERKTAVLFFLCSDTLEVQYTNNKMARYYSLSEDFRANSAVSDGGKFDGKQCGLYF